MARPTSDTPTASIRRRGDTFQLRWFAKPKQYELTLGHVSAEQAKTIAVVATAALAGRTDWPDEIAHHPTVRRYLRVLEGQAPTPSTTAELVDRYFRHMKAHSESAWPHVVRTHLRDYFRYVGDLEDATPFKTSAFLDSVAEAKSVPTRNRNLTAISGFCRWLKKTGQMPKSWEAPSAGCKYFREEHCPTDIVILDPLEMTAALHFADTRLDGIAIWIAIYAGLRRSEIVRLRWENILPSCIEIVKSKTKNQRQVPLSEKLRRKLDEYRRKYNPDPKDRIVPWPEKLYSWQSATKDLLLVHWEKACPEIPRHKRGWNVFRHTFASRHAQHGLSIDVIAAWLGDSPKICREHYARYVPENMKDIRIDYIDAV